MLDEYKELEPQVYNLLVNTIKKKKISHAYLIEIGRNSVEKNIAISFAKSILCPYSYTNNYNCKGCMQCKIIDNNDFPELTIIEPDGIMIKKQQLIELQKEFSKKSLQGKYKVYIIRNAELMNSKSANSILKFLEEPPENVVAILTTDNKEKLLNTIVSRCQVITLNYQGIRNNRLGTIESIKQFVYDNINDNENESLENQIKQIIEYIIYYEHNKEVTLIEMNNIFCEKITIKEQLYNAFEIFILFYKDLFNKKLDRPTLIFNDYSEELNEISSKNTLPNIINKISIIEEYKNHIKYNVNQKLLMDGLIITLEEVS